MYETRAECLLVKSDTNWGRGGRVGGGGGEGGSYYAINFLSIY